MNINFLSPINQLSFGIHGASLLKSLDKNNNVALFPIGPVEFDDNEELVNRCIAKSVEYDGDAPSVRLMHPNMLAEQVARKRVGYTVFETTEFSGQAIAHMNSQDLLIVPSRWAKGVLEPKVKVPIVTVPHGFDPSIFHPRDNSQKGVVRFLHIGKWEHRKAQRFLIDVFASCMMETEVPVELWLMCNNNRFITEEEKLDNINYARLKLGNRVKFINPQSSSKAVADVISYVDCGVFPSRAEGWNLGLMEMMAMGKPCIATNYSAHTEYCNHENAYLIDIDKLEFASDGKWFDSGEWAHLGDKQFEQLRQHMKSVYNAKVSGQSVKCGGVSHLTWDNTAETLVSRLSAFFN